MHGALAAAQIDHRGDEELVPEKVGVGLAARAEVHGLPEVRPQHGQALRGLREATLEIGPQRGVDIRQAHGVRQHLRRVELGVGPGADRLVAAHQQAEAGHLHPADEELPVPFELAEGEETADVAVDERHARKAQRKARGHHAGQAVVARRVGVLVSVPEDRRVFLHAEVAGAAEEHRVRRAVFLDGLAVDLRPEHRPAVVQLVRVALVQHAVHRQILAEVGHPAGHAQIEHVLFDQLVFDEAHGLGVRQVEHAGVEGRGLDVVDAAVGACDQPALFEAERVEAAVFDEIGVDVAEEAHAARAELPDRLAQPGIERLVGLPVPPDLLAHDGAVLAAPVLAPDGADLRPGVEHGEGLAQHGLRAALHAEDHAVEAPVGQVLPVGQQPGQQPVQRGVGIRLPEPQCGRAGVEGEDELRRAQLGHAVGRGVEEDHAPAVGDEDRHRRVAADGAVRLFTVERAGEQRLFDDRGGLDVLGDEVDDGLAAQVRLPVLLAAAEHGFAGRGRQAEAVGPALLALHSDGGAAFDLRDAQAQLVPLAGEDEAAARVPPQLTKRDIGRLAHRLLHGAAVGLIAFFAAQRRGEGLLRTVGQQGRAVGAQGEAAVGIVDRQHSSTSCSCHGIPPPGLPARAALPREAAFTIPRRRPSRKADRPSRCPHPPGAGRPPPRPPPGGSAGRRGKGGADDRKIAETFS